MADWPLAGMNNFGYPGFNYRIQRIGPPVLVTRFADGSEVRRQKNSTITRRFIERWEVNRTDMDAMVDFYESKGLLTTFTKLALDPKSGANFLTDEATVRFESEPTHDQVGPSWYEVTFTFIEVTP